jgi:hypothetical protein
MVLTEGFNGGLGCGERPTAVRSNQHRSSLCARRLGVEGGNFEGGTVIRGQKDGALAPFIGPGDKEMASRGKSGDRQSGDLL